MLVANDKEKFIKAWKAHIDELHLLRNSTENIKLEVKLRQHIDELNSLVNLIAEECYKEKN